MCLKSGDRVLEVASGTGQHALYFSTHMPDVQWQPSDVDLQTYALADTISASRRDNLQAPIVLDIAHWPSLRPRYDAVFSANCLHIIPEQLAMAYVPGAAKSLKSGGLMLLYGPFKYGGKYTTSSNEEFDTFLRRTYPGGGLRDFDVIDRIARECGLVFEKDVAMPANNQFLIWKKE